jgi:large subunit ribosomal protein L23
MARLSKTAARNAGRQFMMWMPTMPMTMVSAKSATAVNPAYVTFRTPPRMTKHEIKEYLTKIYNLPVRKVNTMNYDGKRKRLMSRAGVAYFKYKDFKKAVVYFDESFRDVGIGTRVPEIEGDDDEETDVIDVMDVEPSTSVGVNGPQKQIGG